MFWTHHRKWCLSQKEKDYYEVMIGMFKTVNESSETHRVMKNMYDDAFIKTIPRPVHLQELYKDLKRVKTGDE